MKKITPKRHRHRIKTFSVRILENSNPVTLLVCKCGAYRTLVTVGFEKLISRWLPAEQKKFKFM